MMKRFLFTLLICLALPSLAMADGYFGFGYDTTFTGSGYRFTNDSSIAVKLPARTYVASSGEIIDTIGIWSNDQNGTNGWQIGIYTHNGTNPVNLIYLDTITYAANNSMERLVKIVNHAMTGGTRYTIAANSIGPYASRPDVGMSMGTWTAAMSLDTHSVLQNSWVHVFSFNNYFAIFAHYSMGNCAKPTQSLDWIESDTSNHEQLMLLDTYGASVLDSIQYFSNTDTSSAAAFGTYKGAYPDSGTSHTIIFTGLNDDDWYKLTGVAWNHLGGTNCADTSMIVAKTGKPPSDTTPPDTMTWSVWDYHPVVRGGSGRDTLNGNLGDVAAPDYDTIRVVAKNRALPSSRTDGTLVYAGGAIENTQVYLSGFPMPYIDSMMVLRVFVADTAANWATCNADTIIMAHADSSNWVDLYALAGFLWGAESTLYATVPGTMASAVVSGGGGGGGATPAQIWNYDVSGYGGAGDYNKAGFRVKQAGDSAQFFYGASTEIAAIKAKTDILPISFPLNFPDLSITSTTGRVNIGTNYDKSGYALTQTFPSNFSSFSIDGSGRVTVVSNADKSGYSLTQAFPSNFSSMSINGSGQVTVVTNLDKTGYSLTQAFPSYFSALKISSSGYVSINLADYAGAWGLSAFDNTYLHGIAVAADSGATGGGGTNFSNQVANCVYLGYLGVADTIKIPIAMGELIDSVHIMGWFGSAGANNVAYSDRVIAPCAAANWIDTVMWAGTKYWTFMSLVDAIDGGKINGTFTFDMPVWQNGNSIPNENKFSFKKIGGVATYNKFRLMADTTVWLRLRDTTTVRGKSEMLEFDPSNHLKISQLTADAESLAVLSDSGHYQGAASGLTAPAVAHVTIDSMASRGMLYDGGKSFVYFILVLDAADSSALSAVTGTVYADGGTANPAARLVTGGNGLLIYAIDTVAYDLYLGKDGFLTAPHYDLDIAASGGDTIYLSEFAPTPAPPNMTPIFAWLTTAGGETINPSRLRYRPLKTDSAGDIIYISDDDTSHFREYTDNEKLNYGSGSNQVMIVKKWTEKSFTQSYLPINLYPNTLLSDTTSVYEFEATYRPQGGRDYIARHVIIEVPDTSAFNPFAQ